MSAFNILTGKPIGKTPLVSPRRRWEDNITMDLTEIGVTMRNWFDLAQDRDLESPSECGIGPSGSIGHVVSWLMFDKTKLCV